MAINRIKETNRQDNLKPGVWNNNFVRIQDLNEVITSIENWGEFIPLAGTEVGSPVTGDIEFSGYDVGIIKENPDSKTKVWIEDDGSGTQTFFEHTDKINSNDISTISINPLSIGILGSKYYGANYTDNTYVQKKYVDEANADIAVNAAAIASLDSSVTTLVSNLKEITVTLSSAEVLALYATPIELIPAQGAGTIIEVVGGFVALDYGTTAFADGGALKIRDAGTTESFTDLNASVVNAVADTIATLVSFAPKVTQNTAVEITNATGAFTTGDGELIIKLIYRVHNTGL